MEKVVYIPTKTWFLEYPEGVEIPESGTEISVLEWELPEVEDYLGLYKNVGEKYGWTQRLLMEKAQLMSFLQDNNGVDVFLFNVGDVNAGYFEIDFSKEGDAEIVYLGLVPDFIGKGYGKSIIYEAVRKASQGGKNRVWLHTCEHDHPQALDIYQKAGFVLTKEEILDEPYPENHPVVRSRL